MSTEPQQKKPRIYTTSFASVYPHYVAKAEKKGRTKAEVDEIIRWLTGYTQEEFQSQLDKETDFESFYSEAPELNPNRYFITGSVCGVRVEEVEDALLLIDLEPDAPERHEAGHGPRDGAQSPQGGDLGRPGRVHRPDSRFYPFITL